MVEEDVFDGNNCVSDTILSRIEEIVQSKRFVCMR